MPNSSTSTTFRANGSLEVQANGPTWVHVDNGATFGGGSIALNFRDDNGLWKPLQDDAGAIIAYTAGADDFFDFPAQVDLQLVLTGSASPSIYVQVRSEPRR